MFVKSSVVGKSLSRWSAQSSSRSTSTSRRKEFYYFSSRPRIFFCSSYTGMIIRREHRAAVLAGLRHQRRGRRRKRKSTVLKIKSLSSCTDICISIISIRSDTCEVHVEDRRKKFKVIVMYVHVTYTFGMCVLVVGRSTYRRTCL